ncbi:MAG: DUF86 domain-containing protein [Euryarchaeota archaeon]|nr:DUF86 domain-containing protein [Euryarchaeota archaeon]
MKKVRTDIIRTKIKEIEESIQLVKNNMPDNFEEFVDMGLLKDGIYKRMEFAIENVFDICAIINSDLNLGVPTDDESILNNLLGADVFEEDIKEKLKSMRGFRNILVHRYGKIDDELAFGMLNNNINDFNVFIEVLENYLSS